MKTVIVPPPGMFFSYKYKKSIFRRKEFGIAQMLAIEPTGGVVHIRIFAFSENPSDHIAIAHMPILASIVEKSLVRRLEQHDVPIDFWKLLSDWREASKQGEEGVFAIPIWSAVEAIWDTVTDNDDGNTLENRLVESAYPVKDEKGKFNVIHAITSKRIVDGA